MNGVRSVKSSAASPRLCLMKCTTVFRTVASTSRCEEPSAESAMLLAVI